jgi:hypothetical protein
LGAVLAAGLPMGCATPSLDAARARFYAGRLAAADAELAELPDTDKDKVLYLMERGMVRHCRGDYAGSTLDWLEAVRQEERLETRSVSQGAASLVINDRTISYRGYPFEQTLLHSFLAKNYLARGLWEDAAVEARNAIARLERRESFPDDAYSRYLAGLCLEMTGDADGAATQYRIASNLVHGFTVAVPDGALRSERAPAPPRREAHLVCFLELGRVLGEPAARCPFVELYAEGKRLGQAWVFTDTVLLAAQSEQLLAARRVAKEVTRLVVKEVISEAVAQKDEGLGDLVRALLFSLEAPDTRRWETLPRWLAVARVPCPADLAAFDVVVRSGRTVLRRATVTVPLTRNRDTWFSCWRDLPPELQ